MIRKLVPLFLVYLTLALLITSCQFPSLGSESKVIGYAAFSDRYDHSGIEVYLEAGDFQMVTETDKDGKFVFEGIPAGIYIVRAEYEGYIPASEYVVVEPSSDVTLPEKLVLYPEGEKEFGGVEGYAKFIDKTDHEGIVVEIRTPEGEPLPGIYTLTDSDGYYKFDIVPVGTYTVYAYDPREDSEYIPDAAQIVVEPGVTTSAPDLILRKVAQHVLILKDSEPWDTPEGLEGILKNLGFTEGPGNYQYEVKGSDYIESVDGFDPRWVIIIEGDQPQYFYDVYKQNAEKFNEFVKNGGTLLWIACDNGWNYGDFTGSLPGGVTWRDYYDYYNDIVNPTHPLLEGFPTGRPLEGNYASHGGFNNVYDAEIQNLVVFMREHTSDERYPTFIEYRYGSGKVVATTSPLEYYLENPHGDYEWYILLLKRVIEYVFRMPLTPAE